MDIIVSPTKVPVEDHAALFSEEVTFKMQIEVFNKKVAVISIAIIAIFQ